jgi:hypothetical protein
MRRVALSTSLIALLLTAPAVAAPRSKAPPAQCSSAHSRVVAADTQAEVYLAPEDPELPEFLGVYGCSYRYKHSYLLGPVPPKVLTPSGGGGVRLEALAGPVVADAESGGGPTGAYATVEVRDLLNGRVLHLVETTPTFAGFHAAETPLSSTAVASSTR